MAMPQQRGYSGDAPRWAMDMVKTVKVDRARRQMVRPWAVVPQTVRIAVVGSEAWQKP
jgi:hypothetical protein